MRPRSGSRSSAPGKLAVRARSAGALTVVKLGGSLAADADRLASWLDRLSNLPGRIVVVPGGGPFADLVRTEQARLGFGDPAAHEMALLAMDQYGRMLAALAPALAPADSQAAIRRSLRAGRVPVWLPARQLLGRPGIPASWEVTSDSLALWLAERIGAPDVILVKAAPPPSDGGEAPLEAAALAERGLIDPVFPVWLARAGVQAWYLGPGQEDRLGRALDGNGEPGRRIAAGRMR